MMSVVQALGSETQGNSWAYMGRYMVALSQPKPHIILFNHPSVTYIKMFPYNKAMFGDKDEDDYINEVEMF